MVVRRRLADAHPWVVLNLLKAFTRANEMAEARRMEHVDFHLKAGLISAAAVEALRTPLIAYGIAANRNVLETAAQYSHEQGLTPRLMKLDEIFAASTLDQ